MVVYATKSSNGGSVDVFNQTYTPTLPPTNIRDISGIKEEIQVQVLQQNATFQNMTRNDPCFLALDWILHHDQMQVELHKDNLFQRYILTVVSFSFDSPAWENCGKSTAPKVSDGDYAIEKCLVEKNEIGLNEEYLVRLSSSYKCEWYGVKCVYDVVVGLELGESCGACHPLIAAT